MRLNYASLVQSAVKAVVEIVVASSKRLVFVVSSLLELVNAVGRRCVLLLGIAWAFITVIPAGVCIIVLLRLLYHLCSLATRLKRGVPRDGFYGLHVLLIQVLFCLFNIRITILLVEPMDVIARHGLECLWYFIIVVFLWLLSRLATVTLRNFHARNVVSWVIG